jgi:hypothetical protein
VVVDVEYNRLGDAVNSELTDAAVLGRRVDTNAIWG